MVNEELQMMYIQQLSSSASQLRVCHSVKGNHYIGGNWTDTTIEIDYKHYKLKEVFYTYDDLGRNYRSEWVTVEGNTVEYFYNMLEILINITMYYSTQLI